VKFFNNNICCFINLVFSSLTFANLHRSWKSAMPYFYFRSSWPSDLESVSHVSALAMKVSTKFEVDTTKSCLAIALLLLICYVTLTFDILTLVNGHAWGVTLSTPPPSLKILQLQLWVLTSHTGYNWQCACSHCACAVSRDLCIGGKFLPHIWNPWPRFAYTLNTTCMALWLRQMELSTKIVYGTMLKTT